MSVFLLLAQIGIVLLAFITAYCGAEAAIAFSWHKRRQRLLGYVYTTICIAGLVATTWCSAWVMKNVEYLEWLDRVR